MKTILLSAGLLLLMLTSCKKEFLDKNPQDQLSGETFWKTEADVQMGLTGVYSVMTNRPTFNHGRMLWDGLSDIAYLRDMPTIGQGNIEPTTGGLITSIYNDCYVGISRCNIFLANADKAQMDESNRTQYKAEVYFLRGYFYFILTEFYGGVPLYTAPVTVEESKVKQSTKEEVVTQILADADKAITGLPDALYTGHAVKASALALKAQVLMHNQKWTEAAVAAKEIMASGKFSLYNNYKNLFLTTGQENNPEIIFSVRFLLPDAPAPTTSDMNPDLIGGHAHTLSPLQNFVDSFECTDGLSITSSPLYNPAKPFDNRDPRLVFTVADTALWAKYAAGKGETGESWSTPFTAEKYVNWDNAPYSWATRSDQDYIVYRYAQVLLMYAECQNEASGPDQGVYDAVNTVRARPGVNMPPLPAALSQAAMRLRIRHEREVELGMEGLRYWDIKRWKTAEVVIPTIVDPGGLTRVFDPAKHYLFPFAQSELDVNPNLVQNVGY